MTHVLPLAVEDATIDFMESCVEGTSSSSWSRLRSRVWSERTPCAKEIMEGDIRTAAFVKLVDFYGPDI